MLFLKPSNERNCSVFWFLLRQLTWTKQPHDLPTTTTKYQFNFEPIECHGNDWTILFTIPPKWSNHRIVNTITIVTYIYLREMLTNTQTELITWPFVLACELNGAVLLFSSSLLLLLVRFRDPNQKISSKFHLICI